MTTVTGPVYEIVFSIDRDIVGDFDRWLETHVRNMLSAPGVDSCNSYALDDYDGLARRACLYRLPDDASLDAFLEGAGGTIDNVVEAEFPDRVFLDARVLREDRRQELTGGSPDCLNCGAYMRGQYCAVCGQRARSRLISLWELITDAFGDLFEIDSRLWQTLIPLLVRPGRLTHDYLQGRRARYMPPFRMYLVMSLLFFVVAFFDPREDLGLLFEPDPQAEAQQEAEDKERTKQEIRETLEGLAEEGIISEDDIPAEIKLDEGGFRVDLDDGGTTIDDDCNVTQSDLEDMPAWLQRRLTPERLNHICEQIKGDDGKAFIDNLVDNIPAALIVLLPIMAFVLVVLYPLSRRYYVEHLLFFVHFHAFFFFMLTLQILLMRLGNLFRVPEAIPILIVVVASFYIPVHLFVSMRRVYGQGRFITFLKYIGLLVAYFFGFSATMLGALAIAAFSV
jgi:hypothetical protein